MGYEAYVKAENKYRNEVARLDEIAIEVYHGKRGSFVKALADVWCRADPSNKRIVKPAWEAIVVKYDLAEDPSGTGRPRNE